MEGWKNTELGPKKLTLRGRNEFEHGARMNGSIAPVNKKHPNKQGGGDRICHTITICTVVLHDGGTIQSGGLVVIHVLHMEI